ncbi:metal ABC transporter solute-binding protein, Zn/Mn family [Pseudomonas sp. TE3610]
MKKLVFWLALMACVLQAHATERVSIVAAENVYGDIARQIAGPDADVSSILSNPDQDPHQFDVSPSVARSLSHASLVIYNGLGYDAWIEQLLSAAPRPDRKAIVVAQLLGKHAGENPHVWYSRDAMAALADTLAAELGVQDPLHAPGYQTRLNAFHRSLAPIAVMVADLKIRFPTVAVTATEPVYGYVLQAVGAQVRNQRFQLSVMNETEPSASDVAAFQDDLQNHRVRALVYNRQTASPLAERMLAIARQADVPTVAVTEMLPAGLTYQAWLLGSLNTLQEALEK